MNSPGVCGYCGQELPSHSPAGLCPNCLLDLGARQLAITQIENTETGPPSEESKLGSPQSIAQGQWPNGEGQRFGDYELLEKIGEGGMGVVYKARQVNLDRLVAIKLLPFSRFSREEVVQRFRTEAAAAASLQHPNIVGIHDVGVFEGQHYFSMDLINGRTLAEVVRNQPLPSKRAAAYLKVIAEAVHYAHQHGVVHRDLKPSNILIDASDQPHITDFGLAKRLDDSSRSALHSSLTLSGQILGSPNFISPEQAAGHTKAIGPASDIYSLGALLYHLLTRQPPFQADTITSLLQKVIQAEPISPRLLNPDIPGELETICLKCLEKEPSRRYSNGQTLAEDLGRFLESKPIEAKPIGAGGRALKWCRRRPTLAAMSGALVMSLLMGIAGVLWEWRQARQTARAEAAQRQRAEASEYAADMHLAQLALGDNNSELALSLLNRHRPQAKTETDLRGWEWLYLWQLCQGDELFTLHRYPRLIQTVALSRDRKTLAVATDSEVELWDLQSRSPMPGFSFGATTALAFSPATNLLAVATPSRDGPPGIQIWDLDTRARLKTLPRQSEIRCLSFSPYGRLLATFDGNGTVEVTDWISGQALTNFAVPVARYAGTGALAFSPNGSGLAIGEAHGQMRLLDLRKWTLSQPFPSEPTAGVSALAFSPKGDLVAAGYGYDQGVIRVWNTHAGQLLGRLTNHTSDISGLVFSTDSRRLFSASPDETIRIWDIAEWKEIGRLHSTGEGLTSLALLPDGKTLVTGGNSGSVCFWDATMSNRIFEHTNLTISSSFGSFAQLGAASFSAETLDPRAVRRCGPSFLPDSGHFVALDQSGGLQLWQTHPFRLVQDLPAFGSNHWSVVISPDGHWLATGDCAGTVTICDWTAKRAVKQFAVPFEFFGLLRFSSSGHYLVARLIPNDWQGRGAQVRLWRASDWSEVPLTGEQFAKHWTVELSPDDRTLAVGYDDGTIKLFRFPSQQWQMTLTNKTWTIMAIHFTAAGRLLVSSSLDGLTSIWDVANHRLLAAPLGGHRGNLFDAVISPDGHRLATGGGLGREAVKLWDLTAQRQLISLEATGKYFFDLTFSADGNTLSATALTGEANLWHAPSRSEIEAAEAKESR